MKKALTILASLLSLALLSVAVQAAPVTLTLNRTSPLFNEDPPGAPIPLGRTQYDAGDVMDVTGAKIGEYLRVKDTTSGSYNSAAVTISIFLSTQQDPRQTLVFQGVHSFNNGDETGALTSTWLGVIPYVPFKLDASTNALTINFP